MIKFNIMTSDVVINNNGNLETNSSEEEVVQRILFKISLDKSDWFMDEEIGIPWTSEIFKIKNQKNQEERIKFYLKKELQNDEAVEKINEINIENDIKNRKFNINFSIKCKNGKIINISTNKEVENFEIRGYR